MLIITAHGTAHAASGAPALQLVVDLTDGSRIVGTPAIDRLKVTTQYADLEIQLSQVCEVEFSGTNHAAGLNIQNGDLLTGQLSATEIAMKTVFGQVVIPMAQVKSFRVRASGGKTMPGGLVLYYSFDANVGDRVIDESGSGNDGTIHGATCVNDGKIGAAMSFSGAGGQKIITKNEDNLQLQDFTIMAWVKRGSTEKSSNEWEEGGAIFICGQGGYAFGLYANGSLGLSKVGYHGISAACKITDGNYHHVAVTKSGSKVVFYLDGKPDETEFDDRFQFGNGMAVGARPDVSGPMEACFLGTIDELAVFNRPLSEDEVKQVYESQK